MSWWTYVTRISGTESPKVMASRTGIDAPNFSKWKGGQIPGPQIAATFARAYGRPVLEAFVAADFLTAAEAKERPTAAPSLSSLSEVDLLEEVLKRMKQGGEHGGDTATTKSPGSGPRKVSHLPTAAHQPGKLSKGQQRRKNAERAGEPDPDDPQDLEPR